MAGFVGTGIEASEGGTGKIQWGCVGAACIGEAWAIVSVAAR